MEKHNNSTFLIKSSNEDNRSFGTGFCIYKDENGSFLLTAGHVVESCGRDNLFIASKKATLLHISSEEDTIDLALIYVKGLTDSTTLKLSDEKAQEQDKFTIDGYRLHKSDHAKEPLKGFIKKAYRLESEKYKRNIYELTINDGDSIEQGYSGSAILSTVTGLVVAIATDRKTNGKQAYATPAYYIKELWKDMPENLFESFNSSNPYKGLNSFTYNDRENYFGRKKEKNEIANSLKETRLFTLMGASGSGKSSLLFAGVVPLIEGEDVEVLSFRPLDNPFKSLAKVFISFLYDDEIEYLRKIKELSLDLSKNKSELTELIEMFFEKSKVKKLYLIIDQFEELFTLTKEQKVKNDFLDQLITVIHSKLEVTLVLSIRVDFLSNIAYYEPFNVEYNAHPSKMLSQLNEKNLKNVIENPARNHNVVFQDGLVTRIIDEIKGEAGQLPLLEFALEQLWEKKENKVIMHQALDDMKSISHSISHYADSVYRKYPKFQKSIKKVFIKLINPGMDTSDTRRIASLDDFDDDLRETITLLATERLIVTKHDKQTNEVLIDIVHEALIKEWKQLHDWIKDYHEFLVWEKRLRDNRQVYIDNKMNKDDLLKDSKLKESKKFFKEYKEYLSPKDRDYIKKSMGYEKREIIFKVILFLFIILVGYYLNTQRELLNKQANISIENLEKRFVKREKNKDNIKELYANMTIPKAINDNVSDINESNTLTLKKDFIEKNIGLIYLLNRVDSIYDSEKKYWFEVLPTLGNDKLTRFFNLLQFQAYKSKGDAFRANYDNKQAQQAYFEALKIDDSKYYIYDSLAYIESNETKKVEYYEKSVALNSSNLKNYRALARIYSTSFNDIDKALEYYKKVLEFDSKDMNTYNNIFWMYKQKNMPNKGIEFMKKEIEKYPENTYFLTKQIAGKFNQLKKWKESISFYKKAIKLKPKELDNYFQIGIIHQKNYAQEDAKKIFEKILEIDSNNTNALNRLGNVFLNQYKYKEAINSFNKCLKIDENQTRVLNNLGYVFREIKEYDKGIEALNKALKIEPTNLSTHLYLAYIYKDQRNYKKEEEYYQKAIKIAPENIELYNRIALDYRYRNQTDKVIKYAKKSIELNPNYNAKAYDILARIYDYPKKDYEQSLKYYKLEVSSLSSTENLTTIYYSIRELYKKKQQYNESIEYFTREIDRHPKSKKYLFRIIGDIYVNNLKNYKKAKEYYQKLLDINPNDINTLMAIGNIYIKEEKFDKAIEYYESLEKKIPKNSLEIKEKLAYIYGLTKDNDKRLGMYQEILAKDSSRTNLYNKIRSFYEKEEQYIDYLISEIKRVPKNKYKLTIIIADIFYEEKKYKEAVEYYLEAEKINPKDFRGEYSIAFAFKKLKKYNKAIEYYHKLIKDSDLYSGRYYYEIENIYREQNKSKEGIAYFENEIIDFPKFSYTLNNSVGDLYLDIKDYANAEKSYNEAIKVDKSKFRAYANIAKVYLNQKKYDKAINFYKNLMDKNSSENLNFYNSLINVYDKKGALEEAVIYFESELKKYPENTTNILDYIVEIYYYKLKDYDKAIATYEKLIILNPKEIEYYNNIAQIYKNNKKNYFKAIEYYEKTENLTDDKEKFYKNIAFLYYKLENYNLSINYYKKALKFNSNDFEVLENIAKLYNMSKEYAASIKYYQLLIERDSKNKSRYNMAVADNYENSKNIEKALEYYKVLVKEDLNSTTAYYKIYNLYNKMNKHKESLLYFQKELKNNPKQIKYLNNQIFNIYSFDLKDYNKSIQLIEKRISKEPKNIGNYYSLATIYKKNLKNSKKIIDVYNKILEIQPKYAHVIRLIGQIYEEDKDYDNANKYYIKSIETNPKYIGGYIALGELERKQKENKKALNYFLDAEKYGASYKKLFVDIALLYYKEKNYDEAIEYYQKCLKFDNTDAQIYVNIGVMFNSKGNYNKSREYYEKALKLNPKHEKANEYLGNIYRYHIKDKKKVRLYYRKVLQINPENKTALEYLSEGNNNNVYQDKEHKFKGLIQKNPKISKNYYRLADFYKKEKEYLKAIKYYNKVAKIDINNTNAYNAIGLIYKHSEEYKKAIEFYNKAIKRDANNIDAYINLGYLYKDEKYQNYDYNKSITYFEKILTLDNTNINAYNNLAHLYKYALKDYSKAINNYKKVIAINSKKESYYPYLNILEIQLTINIPFDKKVEERFLEIFKNNKVAMMNYEKLKLLQDIANHKKVNIKNWKQNYKGIKLNWSSSFLYKWIKNLDNKEMKEKLKEVLEGL